MRLPTQKPRRPAHVAPPHVDELERLRRLSATADCDEIVQIATKRSRTFVTDCDEIATSRGDCDEPAEIATRYGRHTSEDGVRSFSEAILEPVAAEIAPEIAAELGSEASQRPSSSRLKRRAGCVLRVVAAVARRPSSESEVAPESSCRFAPRGVPSTRARFS